ncbi:MAG: hypothetical protein ABFC12_01890 [Methanobacterium sp.]
MFGSHQSSNHDSSCDGEDNTEISSSMDPLTHNYRSTNHENDVKDKILQRRSSRCCLPPAGSHYPA